MLQDVIDRVNEARKRAQHNPQFKHSAHQHAKAIESEQTSAIITKNKKSKAKKKSLADVYKPYFETDAQH